MVGEQKKKPTKSIVAALLKDGAPRSPACGRKRQGKTYAATVLLTDDGMRASFRLEFGHE